MEEKLLLFGFDDLFSAPAIAAAVKPLSIPVLRVPRKDYHRTLAELAGLTPPSGKPAYAGKPLGGRMLLLCGLGERLDELLPILQSAGAGPSCLKAVLTVHNKDWTPPMLYAAISKERAAMSRQQSGPRPGKASKSKEDHKKSLPH